MKKLLLSAFIGSTLATSAQTHQELRQQRANEYAQSNHCKGTTKKNEPCQQVIINKEGYCRLHNPKAIHCAAIKKSGGKCQMIVKTEGENCRVHKFKEAGK